MCCDHENVNKTELFNSNIVKYGDAFDLLHINVPDKEIAT